MTNKKKGIFYIILAAFSFATMSLFIQLSGDVPFMQKTLFRNIVALCFAFAVLLKQGSNFKHKKGNFKLLVLRSTFGAMGIFLNFYAIDNLILSDATTIAKLTPFFVILFSYFILKEKIKLWQFFCILIAFLGSLFIINPTFIIAIISGGQVETSLTSLPAIGGFFGAVAAGVAYTIIRKLSINGERGPFIVFFFSAFSTLVCLPFVVLNFEQVSPLQLIFLIGAGVFASFGQFAVTAAYANAPAKDISIYDYSQILFSAIFGLLVFGVVPSVYSLIGYVIIVGVAIFMYKKAGNNYCRFTDSLQKRPMPFKRK